MPAYKRKIINDPVYGFITINQPLIFNIIAHPYYQRLRRIHQMALAYLVYPGAVHTRLHHSLGAYHLMCLALAELKDKGIGITADEEIAAKAAILLHDVGHGPFSHALEEVLIPGLHHESISLQIMQQMNQEMNGLLQLAIDIFTGVYHKPFLHQLVSGQLDVDRMDYLTRDSFYTGVSEGVIGYDRIIKMMTVHNGELVIEEKGIYSIEKFLVARRQMYWQVYLHKTALAAEMMLVNITKRVRELTRQSVAGLQTGTALDYFFANEIVSLNTNELAKFCSLDDIDISAAVKKWALHEDIVLKTLCTKLLNRSLFKLKLQAEPFTAQELATKQKEVAALTNAPQELLHYFAFTGEVTNTLYKTGDERINILFKDGGIRDIAAVDNALIQEKLSAQVKKFYICTLTP